MVDKNTVYLVVSLKIIDTTNKGSKCQSPKPS